MKTSAASVGAGVGRFTGAEVGGIVVITGVGRITGPGIGPGVGRFVRIAGFSVWAPVEGFPVGLSIGKADAGETVGLSVGKIDVREAAGGEDARGPVGVIVVITGVGRITGPGIGPGVGGVVRIAGFSVGTPVEGFPVGLSIGKADAGDSVGLSVEKIDVKEAVGG